MGMFRRAHHDRVKLARTVVKPADVAVVMGLWAVLCGPLHRRLKDVAQDHDIFGEDPTQIVGTPGLLRRSKRYLASRSSFGRARSMAPQSRLRSSRQLPARTDGALTVQD